MNPRLPNPARSHSSFRCVFPFLALTLVLALISVQAAGQVPDVAVGQTFNGETATPTAGGHDYIHLFSETVNPSNGSVSFNVQLPMPKGRGISLPFTYTYNSAGVYHLGLQPNGVLTFIPADPKLSPSVSWSESSFVPPTVYCPPGTCPPPPPPAQCNVATGFTFTDPSGTSHNLGIGVGATSVISMGQQSAPTCTVANLGTVVSGSNLGDGKVFGQFTSTGQTGLSITAVQNWSVSSGNNNTGVNGSVGPFTVTDDAGTTYFFGGGGSYDSVSQLTWALPSKIEDRNGNVISASAGIFNDTLNRPMIQSVAGGANIGGLVYPNATCVGACPPSTPVNYKNVPVPHSHKWIGSLFNGDNFVFCTDTTAVWSVSSTQPAWSGIALPTSTSGTPQQYNFYYGGYTNGGTANDYGLLNEVVYPDGGWVKYTWALSSDASVSISGSQSPYSEMGAFTGYGQPIAGSFSGNKYGGDCLAFYATPVLASRQVSYDGQNVAQTQTFKYQTTWGDGSSTWDWTAKQTYVYTTDNISGAPTYLTTYNYQPTSAPGGSPPFNYGGSIAGQIPLESSVAYYSGTTPSNPVRTVTKSWYDMFHQSEEDTTENALTSKVHYSYNTISNFTVLVGKQEYDFGATAPTRTTTINYKTFPAGPYGTPVPAQPSSVIVSGSSGSAETDYVYDTYSPALAPASAVQHDDANYGAGMTNRGNVTSMTRLCTAPCTSATTTYNYDITGQPASMTDPCGNTACSDMPSGASHTTTYSFVDSPSGGNSPGPSDAYLTNVTYPKTGNIVHQENFQYNYTFGDLTQASDQNIQLSTYQYVDPFDRLTKSSFPDGGVTELNYSDSPTSPSVTSCQLITGSAGATCSAATPPPGWKTSVALMDGMFHTIQTQLASDPDGPDSVETTYDGLGRKLTVSNPHRSGMSSTDGVSSTVYDVLGRPISIKEQDGSMVHTAYDQACTSTTNALGTLVTDEAGNQRRTCTDGLGRLVEVDEPGQGASLPPTAATGSFTIVGAEQSHLTSPATSGSLSGGITVSGTEQSRIAKSGQALGQVEEYGGTLQCTQNGFNTWIPPTGTLSITVHGGTGSTSWGGSCNGSAFALSGDINTMASSLASNLTSSTAGVTATSSTAFITIKANLTGSGTNYAETWNATSSQSGAGFTLSLPAALSGGVDAGTDAGSVSVIVDGFTASATYGSSSTASSVASTLFTGLSNSMSPVIPSGTNPIVLTSKVTGAVSNYTGTATSSSTNSFSPPSFSAGPASFALTGGVNAVYAYDAGTVSVTVGTFTATASYGASDTPSTIASSLANYFNTQSGSPVTAVVSGATVNLTSSATGYAADLYFLGTSATSQSGTFSTPSFVASTQGSNLTGGTGSSYQYSLATPYVTLYTYDERNNLLQVTQKGSATSSSQWRTRSFVYDSLSRLTQAQNPESGTISYTYDANSNLVTKTAPSPNQLPTGTKTVVTTYTYDALNRLTGKSYVDGFSNPSTPNVVYGYDGVAPTGCTKAPPILSDTYPIGRRTSMCDGSGSTSWRHDAMGRILIDSRFIGAVTPAKLSTYGFNFDGSLNDVVTPPLKFIAYTVGAAGRALSAIDTTDNINFVTNAKYAPPGELQSLNYGGPINGAISYNSRLQPMQLFYGTNTPPAIPSMTASCPSTVGNIMNKTYDFGLGTSDNGNVLSIGNCLNAARSQSFSYDGLNRIASAISSGPQWGETFTIDSWGNLTNESQISGKTNHEGLNTTANTNNQLVGFGYDTAGNMTSNGSTTYIYDAENRLIWTSGERYIYDGDGKRVEKCVAATPTTACPTSGTNGTLYWRGTGSDTLDETDLSGNPVEEYIFFNGQRIARRDVTSTGATIAVHYYFSDQVGSHSVIENATGTATEQDIDYYPYGGVENDYCTACVAQHYKFNGKERDPESGLDNFGARYDTSNLGRFMTPDWAAKPIAVPYAHYGNPQSLNLYSYVQNNPTTLGDPDGHDVVFDNPDAQKKQEAMSRLTAKMKSDEKGLFSMKPGKDGQTHLRLDKAAAAKYEGVHTAAFKDLKQAVQDSHRIGVQMSETAPGRDPGTTIDVGQVGGGGVTRVNERTGNSDVYLSEKGNPSGTVLGTGGKPVADPPEIVAAHEVFGHARLAALGLPHGEPEAVRAENEVRQDWMMEQRQVPDH